MTRPPEASPLISVVLPVNGVEEYLPACLDSVLGQQAAGAPIEVVAIDDASPDRCGQILDERAAADPRLRVVHRPDSAGPGGARNLGLSQARGEYVWFADPDDLLADGALAAVGEALTAQRPDVLLLDYVILHPSGRRDPSPGAELLRARPPTPGPGGPGRRPSQAVATTEALTLADRPALVNRSMTVWSKVLRRDFLAALNVPFPAGIHEDVPVSCAALLTAERITLLDRVCYLYRQRPRSFLATTSMGNFAIFDSYQRVFGWLDGRTGPGESVAIAPAAAAAVRPAVFARAMEHYTTVLAHRRVPVRARRRFFRRMAADYRRHRPAGYQRPAGARGMKMALVEREAYLAYEALAPVNDARVALRRLVRRPAR